MSTDKEKLEKIKSILEYGLDRNSSQSTLPDKIWKVLNEVDESV